MAGTKLRKSSTQHGERRRKWSQHVTRTSNALDLEPGIFRKRDPELIARSLKRSAEHSRRRKSSPYQSAMSMLNFYINRAGKGLTKSEKAVLERSKSWLRRLFHHGRVVARG